MTSDDSCFANSECAVPTSGTSIAVRTNYLSCAKPVVINEPNQVRGRSANRKSCLITQLLPNTSFSDGIGTQPVRVLRRYDLLDASHAELRYRLFLKGVPTNRRSFLNAISLAPAATLVFNDLVKSENPNIEPQRAHRNSTPRKIEPMWNCPRRR